MPQQKQTEQAQFIEEADLPKLSVPEYEFVRLLVHTGKSASEAYRQSHDARGLSESAVWTRASRLRGDARIQEWEQALLEWGMTRGALTHEEYVRDMQALARRAERAGNYGAAVNAQDKAAKASGLYVERIEHITDTTDVESALAMIEQYGGQEARRRAELDMGIVREGDSGSVH